MPIIDLPGFPSAPAHALVAQLAEDLERAQVPITLGQRVVDYDGQTLRVADAAPIDASWIFYAPGLRVRRLNVPGENAAFSGSVSELVDRSGSRRILMVGAGDRGVEGALRLDRAGHKVTLVSRSRQIHARLPYRKQLQQSRIRVMHERVVERIERGAHVVIADLGGSDGRQDTWEGSDIVVRVGMEPDVIPQMAVVRGDQAYAKHVRMTVIGDAALEPWERSLVTAFASAMRAVKWYVKGMDG